LDEPLSGLDPETAAHLLKLFRKLAQRGKAVVVSTHAMENFELYDKIAILDQGVLIYFGSPKGALEFFQVDNPARIYSCLEKRSPKKWEEDYHRTPFYYHFIVEPRLQAASKPLIAGPSPLKKLGNYLRQRVSWRASLTLMSRYLDIKLADRKANLLLLGQSVILGGILATISSGERIALILMMMVVYMGVINGLREIVRENTIFARERLVFLKIPSYLASKFFVLSIYVLFQVFIFLGIAKVFIGLPGDFNGYLITLGFCGLASLSFGLFCSVISGNSERANFMIPIALLPQVFYSGTIVRIEEMDPVNRAISTLVISRWTIYGFMENYVGHRLSEVWHQALANIYLAVFFLVVTAILLYSRRKESIE
jgi:hypothetical protein